MIVTTGFNDHHGRGCRLSASYGEFFPPDSGPQKIAGSASGAFPMAF